VKTWPLTGTAQARVGRGLLAIDESKDTSNKRFVV
jgi:fructose-bisphosphate aldolase class 1